MDSGAICFFWPLCLVLLWTWMSDGVRWRPGENRMIPQLFQDSSAQVPLCSWSCQECVTGGPCSGIPAQGSGLICPDGAPFYDLHKGTLQPREALQRWKIWEARLHVATGAFASWAGWSTCWVEASVEGWTNWVRISGIGSLSARNQGNLGWSQG